MMRKIGQTNWDFFFYAAWHRYGEKHFIINDCRVLLDQIFMVPFGVHINMHLVFYCVLRILNNTQMTPSQKSDLSSIELICCIRLSQLILVKPLVLSLDIVVG